MFGLSAEKLLLIAILAIIILGPDKLPYYAKKFAELVKKFKRMIDNAQATVKTELGDEYQDLDWKKLDPRQYDPRRIVREALLEEKRESRIASQEFAKAKPAYVPLEKGEVAPFDPEAT